MDQIWQTSTMIQHTDISVIVLLSQLFKGWGLVTFSSYSLRSSSQTVPHRHTVLWMLASVLKGRAGDIPGKSTLILDISVLLPAKNVCFYLSVLHLHYIKSHICHDSKKWKNEQSASEWWAVSKGKQHLDAKLFKYSQHVSLPLCLICDLSFCAHVCGP